MRLGRLAVFRLARHTEHLLRSLCINLCKPCIQGTPYADYALPGLPLRLSCCRSVLGIISRDGCMAQWLALPARNLLPVPDSLSDDLAVFCEPLAAACRILEQGLLLQDSSQQVAVVGGRGGGRGCSTCKHCGA